MPRLPTLLAVTLLTLLTLPALAAPPQPDPAVNLLAIADWGSGRPEQKQVARTMAAYAAALNQPFHAALLAGDNFYGKLASTTDKRWTTDFESLYDKSRLNFPFYPVAGNHDYENNKLAIEMAYARENPQSRWKFPARWYRVDLPADADNPFVSVLMLESNRDKLKADWTAETKWLESQLAQIETEFGTKHWTIAVAHHPLYSNGAHGDNGVLQTTWGPIFKQHKLDFYLAGHDHDLQHLEHKNLPDTSLLLTGGGGAKTRDMRRDNRGPFSKRTNGFTHVQFTPEKATVNIVDLNGSILHTFEKSPTGQITVTTNTKSDPASKNPLKTLLGRGDEDD
jgi:3',5'-cyclic AMP phosphodiesterase CpdA